MKVKFNGGIKDVLLTEVTAENYIVPQREERFWHVLQEKREFDQNTGQRKSRPVLQKYDTKAYPTVRKYLMDAGYTITVLHDPTQWMKQQEQLRKDAAEKTAKMKAAEQAKAAAKEREALKAELRKELLAELKEEQKKNKKNNK
jgi:hypothetical protein